MLIYIIISGLIGAFVMMDEVGTFKNRTIMTPFEILIWIGVGLLLGWIVFPLFLIRWVYREVRWFFIKDKVREETSKWFKEE